jgi:hypothetical protein
VFSKFGLFGRTFFSAKAPARFDFESEVVADPAGRCLASSDRRIELTRELRSTPPSACA